MDKYKKNRFTSSRSSLIFLCHRQSSYVCKLRIGVGRVRVTESPTTIGISTQAFYHVFMSCSWACSESTVRFSYSIEPLGRCLMILIARAVLSWKWEVNSIVNLCPRAVPNIPLQDKDATRKTSSLRCNLQLLAPSFPLQTHPKSTIPSEGKVQPHSSQTAFFFTCKYPVPRFSTMQIPIALRQSCADPRVPFLVDDYTTFSTHGGYLTARRGRGKGVAWHHHHLVDRILLLGDLEIA